MTGEQLPEHVRANREAWDRYAVEYVDGGRRNWGDAPAWGIWKIPESELQLLPPDLAGKDAVELGCGTAYVSAWLARLGARPVGIDNSPAQLETARTLQQEFGIDFPLHLGNAEATPFDDASFDFAISEYGAALWADPYAWIPEAARLLRPGGRLMFLTNSTLLQLTVPNLEADGPAGTELLRPQFGMHSVTWPDDTSVEFHLPHGKWIDLLGDAASRSNASSRSRRPPTPCRTSAGRSSTPTGPGSGPPRRPGSRASAVDPGGAATRRSRSR